MVPGRLEWRRDGGPGRSDARRRLAAPRGSASMRGSRRGAQPGFAPGAFRSAGPDPIVPFVSPPSRFSKVSPARAQELVLREGFVYLDVRSEPEFTQGRPQGALNVPLLLAPPGCSSTPPAPSGLLPNPLFLAAIRALFPEDAGLVIGCRSGCRALRAAELLAQAGYRNVAVQRAGFEGSRDAFGCVDEPGWLEAGLPVEVGRGAGSFEVLLGRAGLDAGDPAGAMPG